MTKLCKSDVEEIKKHAANGNTFSLVAFAYGVSRQRINQIAGNNGRPRGLKRTRDPYNKQQQKLISDISKMGIISEAGLKRLLGTNKFTFPYAPGVRTTIKRVVRLHRWTLLINVLADGGNLSDAAKILKSSEPLLSRDLRLMRNDGLNIPLLCCGSGGASEALRRFRDV